MKTQYEVKHTALLLDESKIEMVICDDQEFNLIIDLPDNTKAGAIINETEVYHLYTYISQFFVD